MAVNSRIGKGFSALAPVYDHVVKLVFGSKLWQLQAFILKDLPAGENCLIIGGGSGKIMELALKQNLANRYFYAELSDKMIDKTKARVKDSRQAIEYANEWKTWQNQSFDYIILPFVLDCYREESVNQFVSELSVCLAPQGKIVLVDFTKTKNRLQSFFIKLLYLFFSAFTKIEARSLAPFKQIFQENGFEIEKEKALYRGWIQAIVWTKISAKA